jgi:flavin-dependent dehydrogenase
MDEERDYDVIIVGAGPAGISTALHLARIAPELIGRTLILEKARHPRHKLCGGGILADAEYILQELGLDITEVPHCDVDWAHFDYAGKGFRMRSERKGAFAFRTIRRHEFDAWLAEKARGRGFRILEEITVRNVTVHPSEVVVQTDQGEFHAAIVVGADGSKSVVRRAVAPRERSHTARLLEVVTEPRPERSFHIQADSYFEFLYLPEGILGYSWDFPALEAGKPVRVRGIYDANIYPVEKSTPLTEALANEFRQHGYDLSEYSLEGHPLRWFEPRSLFACPRVLLAGDAAGSDALFGEGISIALGYGRLAAEEIQNAFGKGDFRFEGYKRRIMGSEMGRSLWRRTLMAKVFSRFRAIWFQKILWRRSGRIVEWVMQHYMIGWAKREKR